MARTGTGSVYFSHGAWFAVLTIARKRKHFRMSWCESRGAAEERLAILAGIAGRLREAGKDSFAKGLCRLAAEANEEELDAIRELVGGVISGTERKAREVRVGSTALTPGHSVTLREFALLWTRNELAQQYPRHVLSIDHDMNRSRLDKYILNFEVDGIRIGDIPVAEFTLDHADHVTNQPTLRDGSARHVAQIIHRLLALAAYPARLIPSSPIPRGWLPRACRPPQYAYLYPTEEARLLGNQTIPLVYRVLIGFLAREGIRKSNAQQLRWSYLTLEGLGECAGTCTIPKTKNRQAQTWPLDKGTVEALRRWRKLCPSEELVFPDTDAPENATRMAVDVRHLAAQLRRWLRATGITRQALYTRSSTEMPFRAHDLRATFVTLALGMGQTEHWVMMRTGHLSSVMLARYRRAAATAAELQLGWLHPMREVIPELAEAMANEPIGNQSSANRRQG